jgi:hypothetical protein
MQLTSATGPESFKAHALFKALEQAMQEDSDNLVDKVRGIYGFKVKNGPGGQEGYWVINAKTGKGSVEYNGKGGLEYFRKHKHFIAFCLMISATYFS